MGGRHAASASGGGEGEAEGGGEGEAEGGGEGEAEGGGEGEEEDAVAQQAAHCALVLDCSKPMNRQARSFASASGSTPSHTRSPPS